MSEQQGVVLIAHSDNNNKRLRISVFCWNMYIKKAEMLWADRKVRVHLQALGTGAIFIEGICAMSKNFH